MREIKFRGKATTSIEQLDEIGFKHNNGWVYGVYIDGYIINGVEEASTDYIAINNWCPVISETVGQDTGLIDQNNEKIYEGDIVKATNTGNIGRIRYIKEHGAYLVHSTDEKGSYYEYLDEGLCAKYYCVVGNIIDSPQLIEKA